MAPQGNVHALADRVRRIIKEEELKNHLIKNSLQTAKGFSDWSDSIDKLIKIYKG